MITKQAAEMKKQDSFLQDLGSVLPRTLYASGTQYSSMFGMRNTWLKTCGLKSPVHGDVNKKTNPLQKGTWFDDLAKNGQKDFFQTYEIVPEISKASNKGKTEYINFLINAAGWKYKGPKDEKDWEVLAYKQLNSTAWEKGKNLVPEKDWSDLQFMYESFLNHEMAQNIVKQSQFDFVCQWDSEDEQLPPEYRIRKCQFDYVWNEKKPNKSNGIDLKTDTDPSDDAFQKKVFDLGYDMQAAYYMEGIEACGLTPGIWLWIVVENHEPWTCHVHYATPETMEMGRRRILMSIDKLKGFLKDKKKRPYGKKINHVQPPKWLEFQMKENGY